jgi:hypothetical protein
VAICGRGGGAVVSAWCWWRGGVMGAVAWWGVWRCGGVVSGVQ